MNTKVGRYKASLLMIAASLLPINQCTASSTFTTTNNNNIDQNYHRHHHTQTPTTAFQFPNLQQLTQSLTNPKPTTTTPSIQLEDELLSAITENGSTKRLD